MNIFSLFAQFLDLRYANKQAERLSGLSWREGSYTLFAQKPALLHLRGTFLLPELEGREMLHPFGDSRTAHAIPINKEHVVIHTDSSAFLYSRSTGEKLWQIVCPSFNFALHVPRSLLALEHEDATITFWDVCTGQLLHRLAYGTENTPYQVNPNGLEFNHDGSILAAGIMSQNESVVALWQTTDGHLLRTLSVADGFDITSLAFHPNGNILAGGSFNDHRVWFWNLQDGCQLHGWEPELREDHEYQYDWLCDLAFSHDGRYLFVCWGRCGLRIWDVNQQQEVRCPLSARELHPIWLAVDPGGHFLAVIHFDGVGSRPLRILRIDGWHTVYEFAGHLSRPAFSLDGRLLATGSASERGSARLIDMETGKEL